MTTDGRARAAEHDPGVTPIFDGLLVEAGLSWPGLETVATGADPYVDQPSDGDNASMADVSPVTGDRAPDADSSPAGWFEPNANTGPPEGQS